MNRARASIILTLAATLALGGCAGTPAPSVIDGDTPPDTPAAATTANPVAIYDPWEGFNRRMYRFNAAADRYVLLPALRAYRTVAPRPVRTGVANFLDNLDEITTFWNALLQAKPATAGVTLARFAINTTAGIGGLFDPATALGLQRREEDFGQTLGVWGVDTGPYLVLPFFGPSTLRDGAGLSADLAVEFALDPLALEDHDVRRLAYWTLYALDKRDRTEFRYYQTGSPFEYTLVRLVYVNYRQLEIER
ncbi:VacJ family lipoprotein [Salinisphaera sp. PC39]|uniref:MlaA family lipoprotein n=1 Tax=Salinisphaera sp. PC39 TaxID=1304156 RepID=UPI00333EF219